MMSLPSAMYPAYCKRAPCSRATRIQRDLRALSSTSRRFKRTPQQILQDILTLLKDKSGALKLHIDTFRELLERLPPWTKWSSREDKVMKSALHELKPSKSTEKADVVEDMLAQALVAMNGNVPYVTHQDFVEGKEDLGNFVLLYTNWLGHISAPHDQNCHVRDEHNQWINDETLRERLLNGWYLHIPTRTLSQTLPQRVERSVSVHHDIKDNVSTSALSDNTTE